MSGEILVPINSVDTNAPDAGKLVIFAKEDGLYIRRATDTVGMRLRMGADDTSAAQLLNNSGTTLYYGDVVVWDVSADEAVGLTTIEGDYRVAGVVVSTEIADGQVGSVMMLAGYVVDVMCDTGAVARGQFLMASSTAGRARSAGYWRTDNTFAVALSEKSSGAEGIVHAMLVHAARRLTVGGAGWASGGNASGALTSAERFAFASEAWSGAAGAALPAARYASAGLGYGVYAGLNIGGMTGSSAAEAYKIDYGTMTLAAQTSANLTTARRNLRYGHNSAAKGWAVAGYTSVNVNTVDKTTYATMITSTGGMLSVADIYRVGVSDGVSVYTAGSTTPTNKISAASETIAASADANITASQYYLSMSFPGTNGYYLQGTSGAKINFASGVGSGGPGSLAAHNYGHGMSDNLTIGYAAGNNASPYDVTERFNPATETYSAMSATMVVGRSQSAVFCEGAL